MKRRSAHCLAALAGVLATASLPAWSAAQETRLGSPTATYDEGMSFVQTVREMPDGRVMIADPLAQELFILDMESGAREMIGRSGGGPEEYRQPDAVWKYRDGKTLLIDLGNARLTELGPDGSFGATHPLTIGDPGLGSSFILVLPQGVDERGNVYTTQRPPMRPGGEMPDSSLIVRVNLETASVDTLGAVKTEDMKVEASGGNMMIEPIPLSAADAWGVATDGRIVVARSGDYHVEWIQPDGRVLSGAPVPFEPVSIGTDEKMAYMSRMGSGGLSVSIEVNDGGQRSMSFGRGGGGRDPDLDPNRFTWPETMAPFSNARINVDVRGRAWVRRNVPVGDPTIYDVFGVDGNRVGSVVMPEGRQVLGFGNETLYVTYNDEFDLVYLERYDLPGL
jgi:hypothetical protein